MTSIRKDGLLLFAEPDTLAVLTPLQILTGAYLAGLMARGAMAAIAFSMLLAWGGNCF